MVKQTDAQGKMKETLDEWNKKGGGKDDGT